MEVQFSIIYLSYIPYGTDCLKNFIESYIRFNTNIKHALHVVFKGFQNENQLIEYKLLLEHYHVECNILFYKDEGFDINAYKWTAQQLKDDFILFFNTKSQFLSSNWLNIYVEAMAENPTSVIAATASNQSYLSSVFQKNKWYWEKNKSFKQNFDKYKLFVKAALLWRFYFKPFPNPHLRTNAFLIDRKLFLSLQFPEIRTKLDAYRFESGRNGFTAQLVKKGYAILLIDKFGKTYSVDEWPLSNTFWQGFQENLLIADNQTDVYEQGNLSERSMLSFLAWGKKLVE